MAKQTKTVNILARPHRRPMLMLDALPEQSWSGMSWQRPFLLGKGSPFQILWLYVPGTCQSPLLGTCISHNPPITLCCHAVWKEQCSTFPPHVQPLYVFVKPWWFKILVHANKTWRSICCPFQTTWQLAYIWRIYTWLLLSWFMWTVMSSTKNIFVQAE